VTGRVARSIVAVTASCLLACGAGLGSPRAGTISPPGWTVHGAYAPVLDKANFVAAIDNRYFPLKPGTAYHYRGYSGQTHQRDDMVVTRRTKSILGITCTVVRDTVSEEGKAVERTFDWYAQDKQGNVWYMGEDSLELRKGRLVRASDSWQSGVDGAKPGIIMRGSPRRGEVYRQEYYPPGGALDQAHVVSRNGTSTVPDGRFTSVLVTDEWSPVEPQLERKYYAAGVGEIAEQVTEGGHERFQLVSVTH